jgi:VCBS repeat-containing protein
MTRRALFLAPVLFLALVANVVAATYDVNILLDTDKDRTTGCTVPTAAGDFKGVEKIITTTVSVNGNTAIVTGVRSSACLSSSLQTFSAPFTEDAGGWSAGVSPTGSLLIETHIHPTSFSPPVSGSMRIGIAVVSGSLDDAVLRRHDGSDIFFPSLEARHRAVASGNSLHTIVLDGAGGDWTGISPFVDGRASSPALRVLEGFGYATSDDYFFRVDIQIDPLAPTAFDDGLTAASGGALNISPPGILANDTDPLHLPLTALPVSGTQHGTLSLNANGSLTYINDGSPASLDFFRYQASNGTRVSNIASVLIGIGAPPPMGPAITSPNHATFLVQTPNSFLVTTSGSPVAAITLTGALPAGLQIHDNGDGTATLSGSPSQPAWGIYPLHLIATNALGSVDQGFLLTVGLPPEITSVNAATFTAGTAGSFAVTALGFPPPALTVSAVLPAGLTFSDNGDGSATLSGTALAGSVTSFTIQAANGFAPNATQQFTLTVINTNVAPSITSANNATFASATGSFTVTTAGLPSGAAMVISESGALPAGIVFSDNHDGTATIHGSAPHLGGIYPFTIRANNGIAPNATQNFTLTLTEPPLFTSANAATFTVGAAGSFTLTADGFPRPAITTISPLPSGVTVTDQGDGTATIAGSPLAHSGGVYSLNLAASSSAGSVNQTFALTVNEAPSLVPASFTFPIGVASAFNIGVSGYPAPTFTLTGGSLPNGVTLSAAGVVSGSPAPGTAGSYNPAFTASNSVATATLAFPLTVTCPAITVANPATPGTFNIPYGPVTFTAAPLDTYNWSATGLPPGLSIDPSTGALSGTPTDNGTFSITVTATNPNLCAGSITFPLTISQPPGVGESFSVVGNTEAVLISGFQSAPLLFKNLGSTSILANDPAPAAHPLTATIANAAATTAGGKISIDQAGGFSYTPPRGFTGTDTYLYSATSNGFTVSATLTFNVANRVWYVKNDAPSGGDGRSNTPYNMLSALAGASVLAPGDIIYLFRGDGSTSGYDTGITLLNGQALVGEGVALVVVGAPLRAAGLKPLVSNGSGDAVTLANDNLVAGIALTNPGGSALAGNGAGGTTTIDNVSFGAAVTPLGGSGDGIHLVNQGGTVVVSNSQIWLNGTGAAVSLSGGAGTISFVNTTLSATGARALQIGGRAAGAVTFDATSSITSSGGFDGVVISENAGPATLTFNGAITINKTGGGADPAFGIRISENGAALVCRFNGTLQLISDLQNATAFFANGGTIEATNAANTIATNGSPAVDFENATIGPNGMIFQSISAKDASDGILLSATGGGPFTVTGTGTTAGSGGTIRNAEFHGAKFSNASNVTLKNMNFNNNATANLDPAKICGAAAQGTNLNCAAGIDLQSSSNINLTNVAVKGGVQIGINGNTVAGLVLDTVTVQGSGDQQREGGVQLVNVTGTATITNSEFSDNVRRQFELQNFLGSLALTITGSTFDGGSYGSNSSEGLTIVGRNNASITASVKSSKFKTNFVHGVLGKSAGNANVNITLGDAAQAADGNVFKDNSMAIHMAQFDASTLTYLAGQNDAIVSPVVFAGSTAFTLERTTGTTGLMTGTITGNTIGNGNVGSGSQCSCSGGISVVDAGTSTGGSRISITGNTVRHVRGRGIEVIGAANGTEYVTIKDNIVKNPDGEVSEAILAVSGTGKHDLNGLCLDIQGNTIGGTWFTPLSANIVLVQNGTSGLRVVNLTGSTEIDAVNYLNGANTNAQAFALTDIGFSGGTGACTANQAPVMTPATFSIDENSENGTSAGTVAVVDADSGQTYSYEITAGNMGNAFKINQNTGEISVKTQEALDYETTPVFALTVQVSDNGAPIATGSGTITINLNAVNEAPVAVDDSGFATVVHGNSLVVGAASGVLTNDTDVDTPHASLTASKTSNPSSGQVTLNSDGSFTYTHDGSNTTTDSFTYRVSDGSLTSKKATVFINIAPDQAPVATADSYSVQEGATLSKNAANGVLANDTDADTPQNQLTAQLVITTLHASSFTLNPNGSFTYTHDGTDSGDDSFTYHAFDGIQSSSDVTVTIHVNAVNDVPVAVNDTYSNVTVENGATTDFPAPGVLANDTDEESDALHVSSVTFGATTLPVNTTTSPVTITTAHGSVKIFRNGRFTFKSNGTGAGSTDSFSYTASDRGSDTPSSNSATVTINLNP